jgi:sulfate permease family protein
VASAHLPPSGTVAVDPREWAAPRPKGLRRVLPILTWLPAYQRGDARFDLIAGATLWGLLVPESIAYAGLAGLPPEAGLYTLLATLAAYVVFGTSRHLVVAATSASAVLLATAVASVGPVNAGEYAANAAAVVLFCAGLLLLAGVLRLGFIAQFLSRPVMEGFVFGLAIFVTVKQLPKLFGIPKGEGNSLQQRAGEGRRGRGRRRRCITSAEMLEQLTTTLRRARAPARVRGLLHPTRSHGGGGQTRNRFTVTTRNVTSDVKRRFVDDWTQAKPSNKADVSGGGKSASAASSSG